MIEQIENPPTRMLAASDHHISLVQKAIPHELFSLFGLDITQQMFMATVACLAVVAVCWPVSRRIRTTDGGVDVESHMTRGRFPQLVEALLVFIRETMARPHLGKLTDKYIKYIWSVFFVILFANLLGLMPINYFVALFAAMAEWVLGVPVDHYEYWQFWGGPAMSSLSVTAAMATMSFIAVVYIGVKENGFDFFKHFAPLEFTGWPMPSALFMVPLAVFMVVLEILGLIIRSGVLALRLFGNIVAGFLVVSAFVGLIVQSGSLLIGSAIAVGTVAMLFLELFAAFIQTFIFTFLTVIFIAQGAMGHHDELDEEEHEPAHADEATTVTHGPHLAH